MANRTMQAKMMKLRKQKRAWAKPYSMKSYLSPNTEVMQRYKTSAGSLKMTEEYATTLQKAVYGHTFKGVPPERKAVLELIEKFHDSAPIHFCLISNSRHEARVFHNSQRTAYILVYQDHVNHMVMRSIEYSNLDRLVNRWEAEKVTWVEAKRLPIKVPT